MRFSPIVLFTYNRPWHTERTIVTLLGNDLSETSDLVIFSDAPKSAKHVEKVAEVRRFIREIKGFKSVRIIEREKNLGLAGSIVAGVSEILLEYDRLIVLEDDMVTSPYFLRYMNEALDLYADDERVVSIHGYCYPVQGLPETFFLKGADCWGWGTWRRGWALFQKDGAKLLSQLKQKGLFDRFNYFGAYNYLGMLKKQIKGKNDSWAVRWYASALLHDKLTLYPGRSLVRNIGNDASGTHCAASDDFFDSLLTPKMPCLGGIEVKEDLRALQHFTTFFKKSESRSLVSLAYRFLRLTKRQWW